MTSSGAPINFAAVGSAIDTSGGAQWLAVTPLMNTTPATISVSINTAGLPSGQYQGSVNIAATDDSGASLKVPVTLILTPGGVPATTPSGPPSATGPLVASTAGITFNIEFSNPNDVLQKNITLTSTSGSPINFAAIGSALSSSGGAQWLSVTPQMSTTPATLAVSVDTSQLPTGQYQGSVNIAATDSSNASLKIPVTLNLSPSPLIDLNPSGLSFTVQAGGANPPDQLIIPTSTTPGLPYTVTVSTNNTGNWLNATNAGVTPSPVDVSVNPAGLSTGTYSGTVTLTAPGVSNSPQTVSVTLTVSTNPTLISNPTAATGVVFNYQINQSVPSTQTVTVDSTSGSMNFSLNAVQNSTSNGVVWLLASTATSTSTPASFTVGVNPVGMSPGQYTGTLVLTAAGANSISIPVTLNVSTNAVPLLSVSPQTLTFVKQGANSVGTQAVTVGSTGAQVTYSVSTTVTTPSGGSWLLASSPSGPTSLGNPSTFFVGVTPSSLPIGSYTGLVTVQPSNGTPAVTIPVTLVVSP